MDLVSQIFRDLMSVRTRLQILSRQTTSAFNPPIRRKLLAGLCYDVHKHISQAENYLRKFLNLDECYSHHAYRIQTTQFFTVWTFEDRLYSSSFIYRLLSYQSSSVLRYASLIQTDGQPRVIFSVSIREIYKMTDETLRVRAFDVLVHGFHKIVECSVIRSDMKTKKEAAVLSQDEHVKITETIETNKDPIFLTIENNENIKKRTNIALTEDDILLVNAEDRHRDPNSHSHPIRGQEIDLPEGEALVVTLSPAWRVKDNESPGAYIVNDERRYGIAARALSTSQSLRKATDQNECAGIEESVRGSRSHLPRRDFKPNRDLPIKPLEMNYIIDCAAPCACCDRYFEGKARRTIQEATSIPLKEELDKMAEAVTCQLAEDRGRRPTDHDEREPTSEYSSSYVHESGDIYCELLSHGVQFPYNARELENMSEAVTHQLTEDRAGPRTNHGDALSADVKPPGEASTSKEGSTARNVYRRGDDYSRISSNGVQVAGKDKRHHERIYEARTRQMAEDREESTTNREGALAVDAISPTDTQDSGDDATQHETTKMDRFDGIKVKVEETTPSQLADEDSRSRRGEKFIRTYVSAEWEDTMVMVNCAVQAKKSASMKSLKGKFLKKSALTVFQKEVASLEAALVWRCEELQSKQEEELQYFLLSKKNNRAHYTLKFATFQCKTVKLFRRNLMNHIEREFRRILEERSFYEMVGKKKEKPLMPCYYCIQCRRGSVGSPPREERTPPAPEILTFAGKRGQMIVVHTENQKKRKANGDKEAEKSEDSPISIVYNSEWKRAEEEISQFVDSQKSSLQKKLFSTSALSRFDKKIQDLEASLKRKLSDEQMASENRLKYYFEQPKRLDHEHAVRFMKSHCLSIKETKKNLIEELKLDFRILEKEMEFYKVKTGCWRRLSCFCRRNFCLSSESDL